MTSPVDLAVEAWTEFSSSGRLNAAFAELLNVTMAGVARFGTTAPPGDHKRWSREAVADAVNGFLAHERTPRRLTTLRARSTDPRSLAAQLEAAVRNWLRDEARRSNRGHVISRIRAALEGDDRFVAVTAPVRAWRMAASGDELYSDSPDRLLEVARAVTDVRRQYWDGERRDPVASVADLRKVLDAVLSEAGCAVDERLLSDVVADRFHVNVGPDAMPAPPDSDVWTPGPAPPGTADETTRLEAASLWPRLDDRVRSILAFWDLKPEPMADAVGLSRSQAYAHRNHAVEVLKTLLGEHESGREIVGHLADFAHAWWLERTEGAGGSSDVGVE